jgi:ATP-binding cassette subfamily B protein/subfamily B ATP-binding cassette protein MsbA
VNAGSNLLQAFSDAATLAVVFLAVEALSALPASGAFVLLLAVAVQLQTLQSLAGLARSASVGSFAARSTALVKARIHTQVLSFSFPCASRYKVGYPTTYVCSGPVAVRN